MNPQELDELLKELEFAVMLLRAQQVQLLAESHRAPEDKIPFRQRGNAAYKRFQELHRQLSESLHTPVTPNG